MGIIRMNPYVLRLKNFSDKKTEIKLFDLASNHSDININVHPDSLPDYRRIQMESVSRKIYFSGFKYIEKEPSIEKKKKESVMLTLSRHMPDNSYFRMRVPLNLPANDFMSDSRARYYCDHLGYIDAFTSISFPLEANEEIDLLIKRDPYWKINHFPHAFAKQVGRLIQTIDIRLGEHDFPMIQYRSTPFEAQAHVIMDLISQVAFEIKSFEKIKNSFESLVEIHCKCKLLLDGLISIFNEEAKYQAERHLEIDGKIKDGMKEFKGLLALTQKKIRQNRKKIIRDKGVRYLSRLEKSERDSHKLIDFFNDRNIKCHDLIGKERLLRDILEIVSAQKEFNQLLDALKVYSEGASKVAKEFNRLGNKIVGGSIKKSHKKFMAIRKKRLKKKK